jgi:uroporphyrinogen decarboxylase
MALSKKERMRQALQYQAVDRLPTQINYTLAMGETLAGHFGVELSGLSDFLDNHMLRVDIDYVTRYSPDGKIKYDWWGVGFSTDEEGYFVADSPLAENKDLDAYPWPDPHASNLLEQAKTTIAADDGQHFIAPNFGFALFERAWSLRGFDTFLMDLALDCDYASEMFDRITEIQLVLIHRFIKLGVDGGYFGDDYGAQKNMLFSPMQWRDLVKPHLARLFAPFREAGLPVLMHSDGQITEILPDLVEIGLTTFNPVQPEVIDHQHLRDTFGDSLSYYGGISTQTVLPHGSPADIHRAVRASINILAPDNTGLLIAPSHRMMTDIPMENVQALVEAVKDLD